MRYLVDQPKLPGMPEIAAEVTSADRDPRSDGERLLSVELEGQRFSVEVLATGPRWLLRVGDRPIEVLVQGSHCEAGDHSLRVIAEQARAISTQHARETQLRSPIAGRIVRLHRDAGEQVAAGEPLLVIEAMKMENELTAPCAGRVAFHVAEGQTVETGALLADVAPA